jgi:hypothetical protein
MSMDQSLRSGARGACYELLNVENARGERVWLISANTSPCGSTLVLYFHWENVKSSIA